MDRQEYLLSFGNAGEFGRFRSDQPLACRRGDRVVVRSHRGLEIGVVMCAANQGHTRLLADRHIGQILRLATPQDDQTAQRMRERSQRLFEDGRRFTAELGLPMEILDAEVLLDSRQAVLHYLRWADSDPRPLMDQLSVRYRLLITLNDLALPSSKPDVEEHELAGCGLAGCGSSGCGSCKHGTCASCLSHKKHKESVAPEYALASAVGQADLPMPPDRIPLL